MNGVLPTSEISCNGPGGKGREGAVPRVPAPGEPLVGGPPGLGQSGLRVVVRIVHACVHVCVHGCVYPCACMWAWVQESSHLRAWWSLQPLPQGIIHAYQTGDIVLGNTTSMGRWEIVGSFFFSLSTITTIGKCRARRGGGAGRRAWLARWPPHEGQGTSAFWRGVRASGLPEWVVQALWAPPGSRVPGSQQICSPGVGVKLKVEKHRSRGLLPHKPLGKQGVSPGQE